VPLRFLGHDTGCGCGPQKSHPRSLPRRLWSAKITSAVLIEAVEVLWSAKITSAVVVEAVTSSGSVDTCD